MLFFPTHQTGRYHWVIGIRFESIDDHDVVVETERLTRWHW